MEKDNIQQLIQQRLEKFYDEYYLSDLQRFAVRNFIQENLNKEFFSRGKEWLFNKINGKRPETTEYQKGCPDIIPNLRAMPIWPNEQFDFFDKFIENFDQIKSEIMNLRKEKGFQPYRGPSWAGKLKAKDGVGSMSHDSGDWNVFYLFLHNMKFDINCEKVPTIANYFIFRHYYHAFISALTENSHIQLHNGPTNKKLRFHIPITGVDKSKLRVADQYINQQEKQPYVFDDSFEHEAWHGGQNTRIVLIIDFWHPDLSNAEVKFFTLLYNAKMKIEKRICEQDNDNFYSIIEQSKDLLQDNQWWI